MPGLSAPSANAQLSLLDSSQIAAAAHAGVRAHFRCQPLPGVCCNDGFAQQLAPPHRQDYFMVIAAANWGDSF